HGWDIDSAPTPRIDPVRTRHIGQRPTKPTTGLSTVWNASGNGAKKERTSLSPLIGRSKRSPVKDRRVAGRPKGASATGGEFTRFVKTAKARKRHPPLVPQPVSTCLPPSPPSKRQIRFKDNTASR